MVRLPANLWPAMGVALALVAGAAPCAHAAQVRVMARTAIHAEVATQGSLLVIEGEVRDAVGRKLAGLPVQIAIEGAPLEGTPISLTSGDDGSFRVRRVLPDGQWQITTRYAGNQYLAPAETAVTVLSERVPLDLVCTAPRVVAATASEFELRCEAQLGGAPWPDAEPMLTSSCLAASIAPQTSADGVFSWVMAPSSFTGCAVSIAVEATPYHDATQVSVDVRPVSAPRVEAQIEAMPMQRLLGPRFRVSGTLFDGEVAYGASDVEIRVDGQPLRIVQASDVGVFSTELTLDIAGAAEHTVQAVWFAQHPAEHELARSTAVAVTSKRGVRELIPLLGALGLAIAGIGIFAGLRGVAMLRLRRLRARRRSAQPVAPVEPVPKVEAHLAGILVLDADNGRRLPECVVTLSDAGSGETIQQSEGPWLRVSPRDGLVVVRASAFGFVDAKLGPLRLVSGETSVIRLRHVRLYIRDLVHSLLDEFEIRGAEARWGRGTVVSIRRALRDAMRALRRNRAPSRIARDELQALLEAARATPPDAVAAAEALVLLLDEAWWSPAPDATRVALADELVTQVRAAARTRGAR